MGSLQSGYILVILFWLETKRSLGLIMGLFQRLQSIFFTGGYFSSFSGGAGTLSGGSGYVTAKLAIWSHAKSMESISEWQNKDYPSHEITRKNIIINI